ncbi:MAG: helix-turn-helix transcriptional regulator [Bacteroidetes bacterium]|nr:helix-turn-helix transcriptional regulator [Bacteroidota bacterium]MCB0513895.1 helix-turn-helix transcriptional regulator [Bacteroidota bacterium]
MNYTRRDAEIKAFGKHLKKIRKSKRISQEELAYRCDIELSQIGRIERGVINTSISNIFIIAEALEISPKDLFDFE